MMGLLSVFSQDRSDAIFVFRCLANGEIPKKHTVHAGQKLRNDSPFHFSLGTFSFWRNGIDLVDEQQAGCNALRDV